MVACADQDATLRISYRRVVIRPANAFYHNARCRLREVRQSQSQYFARFKGRPVPAVFDIGQYVTSIRRRVPST